MSFRDLFSQTVPYRPAPKSGITTDEARAQPDARKVGSLVSPASLATFTGGTGAIIVVWGVIERVLELPHNLLLGVAVTVAIGGTLLLTDLTDPDRSPAPRIPVRILVALINMFVLFNAASSSFTIAMPSNAASATNTPAVTAPAAAK
jgi:hypothetical protein